MPIRYTRHLELRLRLRRIPQNLPRQIYEEAEEHFQNSHTGYKIAVKHVLLYGREREVMVAYYEKNGGIVLITIHPLKEGQKENRLASGRWTRS